MKRRNVLGSALCAALPVAAQKRPRIAYIAERGGPNEFEQNFLSGLRERGWNDGAQVNIDFRWSGGDAQRARANAAELLALSPDLVVTSDGASLRTMRSLNAAVPIVHPAMGDAIASGYASSLSNPDRNITGITVLATELGPKRVELLKEALPGLRKIGVITNAVRPPQYGSDTRTAAATLGLDPLDMRLTLPDGVEAGIAAAARGGVQALIVVSDTSTITYRQPLCDAALRHRMPTMFANRTYMRAGGLMSYGPDLEASFHRAAYFVDRILKGAKIADLPIEQPTTFQMVVNLKVSKALGVVFPRSTMLRTTEVIE